MRGDVPQQEQTIPMKGVVHQQEEIVPMKGAVPQQGQIIPMKGVAHQQEQYQISPQKEGEHLQEATALQSQLLQQYEPEVEAGMF